MQLRRVGVLSSQLDAIPVNERALLVLLGHVMNEVNTVDKITYLSSRAIDGSDLQAQATAAQTMILSRILAGKLYEGWEAIQKGYFRSKVSQTYTGILDATTTAALGRLKKYFSGKSLLSLVRNEFAFHYSIEHANKAQGDEEHPEEMAIYLHERPGAVFFQTAEYLMNNALAMAISPAHPENALDVLLTELRSVCKDLNEFVLGFTHSALLHRIGADALAGSNSQAHISNAPTATRKRIPFFIELP